MGNKNKGSNVNHISVLYMPNKRSELYFWYAGNPFGIKEDDSTIYAFENTVDQTGRVDPEALEVARRIYQSSSAIGYLVAKKDFLVVGVPTRDSSKLASEILFNFFPTTRSVYKRVPDKKQKIAKTGNIYDRMRRVLGAETEHATHGLPEVVLRIPNTADVVPEGVERVA